MSKYDFYDLLEERVENGEDIVLTCSCNGIYAIIDNSAGNSSTIIEYNENTGTITSIVLPNEMYKYLERNNDLRKRY